MEDRSESTIHGIFFFQEEQKKKSKWKEIDEKIMMDIFQEIKIHETSD